MSCTSRKRTTSTTASRPTCWPSAAWRTLSSCAEFTRKAGTQQSALSRQPGHSDRNSLNDSMSCGLSAFCFLGRAPKFKIGDIMRHFLVILILTAVVFPVFNTGSACAEESSMPANPAGLVEQSSFPWMQASMTKLEKDLVAKYGEGQRARISRGLHQAMEYWRPSDGDAAVFEEMARTQFAGDQATLDTMFSRYQDLLEQYFGHIHEIQREFAQQSDLDRGPILPFDSIFSGYDPKAHFIDDCFDNKLAFVVLLNFPLTTLQERLTEGPKWSRRQWAEVRLVQSFSSRIPADAQLATAGAFSEAEAYIAGDNIRMHHLVYQHGLRLFPPGLRLLSHWNLRDEIKADYADKDQGPAKQRMIQQVMERIVTQTIPQVVIDNPHVDWNPYTNEVKPATEKANNSHVPTGKIG